MTTNYKATIPHHANWIWDQLNNNSGGALQNGTGDLVAQGHRDLFIQVARVLESAETCADEYRFNEAAGWIIEAARQVFGVYSETYAGFVHFYS